MLEFLKTDKSCGKIDSKGEGAKNFIETFPKLIFIGFKKIVKFVYLLFAFKYDIYKLPTALILSMVMFIMMKSNTYIDNAIDALNKPRTRFKGYVYHIINTTYFAYMVYVTF